ncbi:stage II sporulation protein D [Clostridium thermopalmarium]|uniref:Amidase enhancer n=1 Tax=Clostridium thermopalmarium DSM 5974 TaxID=1121340 RepID=A0A2T0APB1_9CLOT|nr:stage II sporulation protein D [Clostridium thermopalmarium]MBE6044091.1 stage II sporulation protein D [Clostridium thermopalmarium]PRR70845.1 Amidase enhancer precursor [Clostridium thermopalmarium DSM 5974]PVZ28769.1 stage II sporulation protein D [Clostridium thermopalmarium DSM 5974]
MQKIIIGILSGILFIILLSIIVVGVDTKSYKEVPNNNTSQIVDNIKIKSMYNKEDLNIDVYITKENKIDRMSIEDYVLGVVAAEMPAEFEIEALKAQAVAARTYGLAHKENFGAQKSPKACGADVNDTVEFQVFMNKEERMELWPKDKREEYWDKLNKAVKETENEVLSYDGKLVMAPYYFSTSSGRTEDAKDVFNRSIPYLKSVESPGEERSRKYVSEVKYTYGQLADILNRYNYNFNMKSSTLKNQIAILERTQGGSVSKMKIGNQYISGQNFRNILNLNSANFDIKFNSNDVVIVCKGYGHGVGMSQWGADAMAKEGYNYKEILSHYYQGTDVIKLNVK